MPVNEVPTSTSAQQDALEEKVLEVYDNLYLYDVEDEYSDLSLLRELHISYLKQGIGVLPAAFASLDASRPWLCYWILHALALLGDTGIETPSRSEVVDFLSQCQHPQGGFGGGPKQIAHLAPTYAAVSALLTLGGEEALSAVHRDNMFEFLSRLCIRKELGGGFCIHEGGESDLRACFCAMAVMHMLCLNKEQLAEKAHMVQYIASCQTYEGGLGGEPGTEAHGGYTFCGVAALMMVGAAAALNVPALVHWVTARQGGIEGGFNGRTNKLVDGCYSFWQGGVFPLLQQLADEYVRQIQVPKSPPVPATPAAQTSTSGVLPLPPSVITAAAAAAAAAAAVLVSTADGQHDEQDAAATPSTSADALFSTATNDFPAAAIPRTSAVALFPTTLCDFNLPSSSSSSPLCTPPLYNPRALQLWILGACQGTKGGLRDKPGKSVDYYHTCYCLSGLSSSQHGSGIVLGPPSNLLAETDPFVNVVVHRLQEAHAFYAGRPLHGTAPEAGCES